MRPGDVDHTLGVGIDQVRMQITLRLGIARHRLAQGGEITGVERISGRLGGRPQGDQLPCGRADVLQVLDHLAVDLRRVVRLAQVDQNEPSLQFPPDRIGHPNLRYRRVWILEHIDEVDTAVGRTELVLDATLLFQHICLDRVSHVGDLVRCAAACRQAVECPDQSHRYGRGSPRRCASRCL